MRKVLASVVITASCLALGLQFIHSQELQLRIGRELPPGITFDEETGNYIIRYTTPDGEPVEVVFVPATKIVPEVKVSFSFDAQTEKTTYSYRISNGRNSEQELHTFALQTHFPAPDTTVDKEGGYYIIRYTIPVDSVVTPEGWHGSGPNPTTQRVHWYYEKGATLEGGVVKPRGLLPGQSQAGFSFQSKNLPGVVMAFLRGNTSGLSLPSELPQEIAEGLRPIKRFENDSVLNPTIGPAIRVMGVEPFSAEFIAGSIQSNLVANVPGSMLPSEELRQSLYQKLWAAQSALREEQTAAAKEHLGAILKELTYQPESNISLELLQALVIDVKFVLSKLP